MKKKRAALFIFLLVIFVGCTNYTQNLTKNLLENNNFQKKVISTTFGVEMNSEEVLNYPNNHQKYFVGTNDSLKLYKKNPKPFITKNAISNKDEQQMQIKIVGSFAVGYMLILLISVFSIGHSHKID